MPSAARNIVIEVQSSSCSYCFPLVSLTFFCCRSRSAFALLHVHFSSFRFTSYRVAFRVPPSPLLLRLSSWLSRPCICLSYPMLLLTHLRRLLCCSFIFYLPSLLALPFPRPDCPLRTSASPPRLSCSCPLISSRALVLSSCLLPMSLVCVCPCCAVTLLRHLPFVAHSFRYVPGAAVAFLTSFLPMSEFL